MKNIMLLLVVFLSLFGCENVPIDAGIVEGKVTIGPLCGNMPAGTTGNNPCGFTDEQMDQVYSKYKVAIYSESSPKAALKEVVLNRTGAFSFEVPTGGYSVEVEIPQGSAPSTQLGSELKKTVSISKSKVTTISLNVNTGIQ
jgi:hypothetical protein